MQHDSLPLCDEAGASAHGWSCDRAVTLGRVRTAGATPVFPSSARLADAWAGRLAAQEIGAW